MVEKIWNQKIKWLKTSTNQFTWIHMARLMQFGKINWHRDVLALPRTVGGYNWKPGLISYIVYRCVIGNLELVVYQSGQRSWCNITGVCYIFGRWSCFGNLSHSFYMHYLAIVLIWFCVDCAVSNCMGGALWFGSVFSAAMGWVCVLPVPLFSKIGFAFFVWDCCNRVQIQ